MTFEEFVENVQGWAAERGIYEHSTALAQALKACSEAGELCDAVIKSDRDALRDAIGDVMVCLVNVSAMANVKCSPCHQSMERDKHTAAAMSARWVSHVAASACVDIIDGKLHDSSSLPFDMKHAVIALKSMAGSADLDFMDCCEAAWSEIKDRKGRMVAGGAFVKEQ